MRRWQDGGLTEDDALENIKWIVEHGGVDLIEVSGGTYQSGSQHPLAPS